MTAAESPASGAIRSRLLFAIRGRESGYADAGAVALILILTAISMRYLLSGGIVLGMDAATQFLPWYSYLGESLRAGTLPGWNPHQFSGAPFAGDPLSGWTYLPAMLLFTLLPFVAAAKVYLFIHPLLAGLGVFALARALRIGTSGALLAAVAYEFSGYFYLKNTCCFAFPSVMAWLPLAILGAEMAIRSRRGSFPIPWWGISGLAISQILASWLGQGSYYALLAIGGYVAYRTLLFPPEDARSLRSRVSGAVLHGGAVLILGFGLAAAGLLPRLEYNALSGLAGGYSGVKITGGWSIEDWKRLLLPPSLFYAGAPVLALALAALLTAWTGGTRFAVPYFAGLSLMALTLAGKSTTLLHSALYLLPLFERIHHHEAGRVMVIFYLGTALLAGAAVTHLGERGRSSPALLSLPILAALFLVTRSTLRPPVELAQEPQDVELWADRAPYLLKLGIQMHPGAFFALLATVALVTVYALLPSRLAVPRRLVAVLIAVTVFVDLQGAGRAKLEKSVDARGAEKIVRIDLAEYYEPTGATRFLQSAEEEPSRYVGYDPRLNRAGKTIPYHIRFANPEARALEAENRASLRGGSMQSVQGYNATHLSRYDDYLTALNGRSQEYHDADIFPGGIDSTLLDLLNVRHIVVPANITAESRKSLQELERELPTVYRDERVRIFENPDALPRAWIVHSARRAEPKDALDLLSSGEVDPRSTALLEEAPPGLRKPGDASGERASVTSYEPNRIELETDASARGLLVLSEVYYPAWNAYVDGEPARVYRANGLLRAVSIPEGEHTVELRYESRTLKIGTGISLLTALSLVGAVLVVRTRRPDDKKKEAPEKDVI